MPLFEFVPEPPEILPFNFGKDILDEGDFAHVSCIVTKGDMPLSISWTLQGDTVSVSDSTISTSQAGQRASFLSISSVTLWSGIVQIDQKIFFRFSS